MNQNNKLKTITLTVKIKKNPEGSTVEQLQRERHGIPGQATLNENQSQGKSPIYE